MDTKLMTDAEIAEAKARCAAKHWIWSDYSSVMALARALESLEAARAIIREVDDILVVNWIDPPPLEGATPEQYHKAIADLVAYEIQIHDDPAVSSVAAQRKAEMETARAEAEAWKDSYHEQIRVSMLEKEALRRERDALCKENTALKVAYEDTLTSMTRERDALVKLLRDSMEWVEGWRGLHATDNLAVRISAALSGLSNSPAEPTEVKFEWAIKVLKGVQAGSIVPYSENEARDWVSRFPEYYVLMCRVAARPWELADPVAPVEETESAEIKSDRPSCVQPLAEAFSEADLRLIHFVLGQHLLIAGIDHEAIALQDRVRAAMKQLADRPEPSDTTAGGTSEEQND